MNQKYLIVYCLLIVIGLVWLAKSPYSNFNNRLIKTSDGREVLCKDTPGSSSRYGGGVKCYDVSTEYMIDPIFGKLETPESPPQQTLTLKYLALQKIWILFVLAGFVGIVRQLRFYLRTVRSS